MFLIEPYGSAKEAGLKLRLILKAGKPRNRNWLEINASSTEPMSSQQSTQSGRHKIIVANRYAVQRKDMLNAGG